MEADNAIAIVVGTILVITVILLIVRGNTRKRNQPYEMKEQLKSKTDNIDDLLSAINEAEKNKPQPEKRGEVQPYPPETIIAVDVVGIFIPHKIEAFKWLHENKQKYVNLHPEPNNPHDKNALAVKTLTGKEIGYIPKYQWKLIKTLKVNPNVLAEVINTEHWVGQNGKDNCILSIKLYLNYQLEQLEEIAHQI